MAGLNLAETEAAFLPDQNAQQSSSTILGAAAEYYVMCQLLRRNKIAALAPAGVPDADIIVSDRLGTTLAAIQVKARRDIGSDGGWHMKSKHETIVRDLLFYCFVDFGKTLEDIPRCWVLPSKVVAEALKEIHQGWFMNPGRAGHVRQPTDMRRFLPDATKRGVLKYKLGWLDPYKEAWGIIDPKQGSLGQTTLKLPTTIPATSSSISTVPS